MPKKYFIIGAIIILAIAGIISGKMYSDKEEDVFLPAEEVIIDDSGEDNVTVEHEYRN